MVGPRGSVQVLSSHLLKNKRENTSFRILVLAERNWWASWLGISAAGDWGSQFQKVADAVNGQLGVSIQFGALDNCNLIYGADGVAPRLTKVPLQYAVSLRGTTSNTALCDSVVF
jgi:hypothetical protein